MRHTILVIYYLGKILNFFTLDLNIFLKNKRKFLSVVKNRIKFRVNIFMEQEKKNKKNKSFKNPKFYPPLVGFTRLIKSIELLLADRPSSTTRYYTNPTILTRGNPYDRQRVIATYSHGVCK